MYQRPETHLQAFFFKGLSQHTQLLCSIIFVQIMALEI